MNDNVISIVIPYPLWQISYKLSPESYKH